MRVRVAAFCRRSFSCTGSRLCFRCNAGRSLARCAACRVLQFLLREPVHHLPANNETLWTPPCGQWRVGSLRAGSSRLQHKQSW